MSSHRYRVGQTVRFVSTNGRRIFGGAPGGAFRVVRQLPDNQAGDNQYRVKSTSDGHERVVQESEIIPQ